MNTLFCFSVSVFLMSSFKCQLLDVGMYSRSAAARVRIEQCAAHAKCWQKNMRERDRNIVTYRELKKQAARNCSVEWEVLESSKESFLFDADLLSHLCCFPETLLFISATLTAAGQHLFPYIDPHRGHTHTLWKTHLTSHWPCSVLLSLHISDLFNWSHLLLCLWESSNGREVLLPYGSTGNSKDAWVVTNKRRRLDLTCMWGEVKPMLISEYHRRNWDSSDQAMFFPIVYCPVLVSPCELYPLLPVLSWQEWHPVWSSATLPHLLQFVVCSL